MEMKPDEQAAKPQQEREDDEISVKLARRVTTQEAADILGITERTVRRWRRNGRLPKRVGRLTLGDLLENPT